MMNNIYKKIGHDVYLGYREHDIRQGMWRTRIQAED